MISPNHIHLDITHSIFNEMKRDIATNWGNEDI